ncbi:Hypothetical predicted protein [Lecanosticta acicola]|uniref:Uncharacterized protein n=1 Tax=Lecanosticta acicola TaxID=111012 RepID=A0AAI8W1V6_9PEZI|nr:Hypothetical predicted protein [Lecanosticta acicola]
MSSYEALSAEIDRITSSPYPSQLRTLHSIILQSSDADVSQWASSKPCLIEPLVGCLLETLQQWSYVLDVIARFAVVGSVRDVILRGEASLLHTCVVKSIGDNEKEGGRYRRASIALLSTPLPDTVALPAEAQQLFVQLVEEAAKRPCAGTIEPVYMLLSGTGSLLLGVLSSEILIKFEEHMLSILKSGAGAPDRCLSLYCLSIMNVVCSSLDPEFRLTASSYTSQEFLTSTPTSSRWKAEAMQQFFTGSKAQRSMQLIVLTALWAAGKSCTETSSEKTKALVLANEVILAIPMDLRKNWCSANTITVRKLQEKLCAEGQDETVKTLALRFLGKLCELDSMPHPVLESLEMTFLEPKNVQIAHMLCPRVDDSELFSSVLARAPISLLLQNAVDYAIRAESTELASGLAAVTRGIRDSLAIIEEQKITGHEIRATLNEAVFVQSLQKLRDMVQEPQSRHGNNQLSGWCMKALHHMRSNLAHQISDLLLRACHSSSMSSSSMSLLLSLHASSARGDLDCTHDRPVGRDHLDIEDQDESMTDVGDWREALHMHFKARAQVEQDAVTRLFAKACASLESRCENVEKPLREEQEKRQAVEEHNADLTRAFAEMEARNVDMTIQIRDLEEQKDQHVQDAQERRNENDELVERVSRLEQKLREAHVEGERQLSELNRAKQMTELDTVSAIAKKQEEIDDLQDQLGKSNREAAVQGQEMSALKSDLHNAQSQCERLEESLKTAKTRITELNSTINSLENHNRELRSTTSNLRSELDTVNSNLAAKSEEAFGLHRQLQSAQSEHEGNRLACDRETIEIRHSFEERIEEANELARRLQSSKASLESQIETLIQEHHETCTRLNNDISSRGNKISDLRKRTERLQLKCKEKDQQIAEAEVMRSNLMAAMGLPKSHKLPHRSSAQTQDDPTPPTPTSRDENCETQEYDASLISNIAEDQTQEEDEGQEGRDGPTPKRPRSRCSIVPAVTRNARASTGRNLGTASTHATQASRRQTLGVVSGNRGVSKPAAFKTPMRKKEEIPAEGDGDESTFEGSELFTGTQGARMLDLQAAYDGETMME